MSDKWKNQKFIYYGALALVLMVIGYYFFIPNQESQIGSNTGNNNNISSNERTSANFEAAIEIPKNEVTQTAKFYPYNLDGTDMEIIAVKATDGSIRTALNTCQVCYDSGRGYYVQDGDYLVCQNCGNRFHIDQIEQIKGGCNPVPILEADKKDTGDNVAISEDFIVSQKEYFQNWKNS